MNNFNLLKTTALTTAMVLSLGSTAAIADGYMNNQSENRTQNMSTQQNQGAQFDTFDRDNNNRLDNNEFATYTFYTLDYNNDNMISDEEWDTYTTTWYDPIDLEYDEEYDFTYYDSDNDGYLEANEYISAYDTDLYSSWDMDNDGYIETVEYDDMTTTYYDYDTNGVYVW